MVSRVLALVLACLVTQAVAQQTAPTTPKKAPSSSRGSKSALSSGSATAGSAQGLTIDQVISMVQAGLSEDLIVARLRKEDKAFDLSADDLIKLKKAGVSDGIMKVMLDPKAEIKPSTTAPAATAPQSSTPPVVIQTPVAAIPIANPSGATPAPGTNATGNPNDPISPHDSGIYLYAKDRNGEYKLTILEQAAYQGSKTGGVLGSALTYGLKKAKMKAVIPGQHAGIRTPETEPVFYFYFEDKAAGLGKGSFGAGAVSNPNQFALIKLDLTKSSRETIIGEFGALGSSSGTHEKSMITFKSERLRNGLYKVVPVASMEPGEYCFLVSQVNIGAFGAGASGAAQIFDFAVSPNE